MIVSRLTTVSVWTAACLATAVGTASAQEEVRIALVEGPSAVTVSGKNLTIIDAEVGDRLVHFEGSASVSVEIDGGMLRVVNGKSKARQVLGRATRLFVEADDAVGVNRGMYFGRIEVGPGRRDGELLVINRLEMETYLLGIVGSEMNSRWPIEALKAQAVAARTYAMQRRVMMRSANRPFDLASSVISQVYKGTERITPSIIRAVSETRGEVIAYKHNLAEALFHSTCGGHTVAADAVFKHAVPYLKRRPCKWCRASPHRDWGLEIDVKTLSQRLRAAGLVETSITRLTRDLRDKRVKAWGSGKKYLLNPRSVRRAVGLKEIYSPRFSVRTEKSRAVISGHGFGHGVGMCQWGAYGQAKAGRGYPDILAHYYLGTRLKRLY